MSPRDVCRAGKRVSGRMVAPAFTPRVRRVMSRMVIDRVMRAFLPQVRRPARMSLAVENNRCVSHMLDNFKCIALVCVRQRC
jgi:hypothetical protein